VYQVGINKGIEQLTSKWQGKRLVFLAALESRNRPKLLQRRKDCILCYKLHSSQKCMATYSLLGNV